jgi:hypothetical protein
MVNSSSVLLPMVAAALIRGAFPGARPIAASPARTAASPPA